MTHFAALLADTGHPPEAAAPEVGERLQAYARYLSLLAEEVEARRQHDGPRAVRLGEERRLLEAAMQDPAAGEELAALVDGTVRSVRTEDEQGGETRTRWLELEGGALRAARGLRLRLRIAGEYGAARAADASLDVRF